MMASSPRRSSVSTDSQPTLKERLGALTGGKLGGDRAKCAVALS